MESLCAFVVAVGTDLGRFWPLLTGIGVVIGAIIAAAFIPTLQDDGSFAQIRDWAVKPGLAARYRDLIGFGLHAAGRFYGPDPGLSFRGYSACLLVAFVYPVFLWQLAWVLGGPGTLDGASDLDEAAPFDPRWMGLSVMWAAFIVLVFL